ATTAQVYQEASAASRKLGTLRQGANVNLVSVSGQWAYVEKNGNYGYMLAAALGQSSSTVPSEAAATPQPTATKTMEVRDSSMKVYEKASTSSKKLGTLKKGRQVSLISTSGDWAYIMLNGNYGYCKLSALTEYDPIKGYTVETFSATVVRNGVEFYKSASTESVHTSIPIGTDVTVTAFTSDWAYVQYSGTVGFIQTADLSRQQFASLSTGSTGSSVSTLEKALLLMGYFDLAPDATFDTETQNAVNRFQQAMGRTVNGVADQSMQRVLFSGNGPINSLLSASYTKGDNGSDVTRLQKRLYSLRYLSKTSSADGAYGTMTVNAVAMFQAANGMSTTGAADSATIRRMYSATAVSLPSGKKAADTESVKEVSSGSQVNNSTSISATLASTTTSYSSGMSNSARIEYIIYVAQNQLGKPYVFGATGTSSFDCSGLTMYSFKQGGVSLLRTAYEQGYNNNYSKISSISDLKRGDLVFFNTVSDSDLCDHTGIYLGAGWFIQASSGQHKVVVSTLTSGYYNRTFSWGRRIL
ncbi:MAG: hypothetical protein E7317_05620, partial [Clostridiales bacterium]|nr:hypothetical protein [Clostridiales bacterium]